VIRVASDEGLGVTRTIPGAPALAISGTSARSTTCTWMVSVSLLATSSPSNTVVTVNW
jgi:hypothetical protein